MAWQAGKRAGGAAVVAVGAAGHGIGVAEVAKDEAATALGREGVLLHVAEAAFLAGATALEFVPVEGKVAAFAAEEETDAAAGGALIGVAR